MPDQLRAERSEKLEGSVAPLLYVLPADGCNRVIGQGKRCRFFGKVHAICSASAMRWIVSRGVV